MVMKSILFSGRDGIFFYDKKGKIYVFEDIYRISFHRSVEAKEYLKSDDFITPGGVYQYRYGFVKIVIRGFKKDVCLPLRDKDGNELFIAVLTDSESENVKYTKEGEIC